MVKQLNKTNFAGLTIVQPRFPPNSFTSKGPYLIVTAFCTHFGWPIGTISDFGSAALLVLFLDFSGFFFFFFPFSGFSFSLIFPTFFFSPFFNTFFILTNWLHFFSLLFLSSQIFQFFFFFYPQFLFSWFFPFSFFLQVIVFL